jgi:hypothetical protein
VAKLVTVHLTVGRAIEAWHLLAHFAAQEYPGQGRLKFAVSRTVAALGSDPAIIAGDKARVAAIRHHGVPDKDGNVTGVWPHQPAAWEAFWAEYGPVAEQEMDITVPELPAAIEDFVPPGVGSLVALLPFVESEKE